MKPVDVSARSLLASLPVEAVEPSYEYSECIRLIALDCRIEPEVDRRDSIEITRDMVSPLFDLEILTTDTTEERLRSIGRLVATIIGSLADRNLTGVKSVVAAGAAWGCLGAGHECSSSEEASH